MAIFCAKGMEINKKALRFHEGPGAHDWSRTSTSLRTLPPQGSVSTNSTTWAFGGSKNNEIKEKNMHEVG